METIFDVLTFKRFIPAVVKPILSVPDFHIPVFEFPDHVKEGVATVSLAFPRNALVVTIPSLLITISDIPLTLKS